jgi:hypothetical protein
LDSYHMLKLGRGAAWRISSATSTSSIRLADRHHHLSPTSSSSSSSSQYNPVYPCALETSGSRMK